MKVFAGKMLSVVKGVYVYGRTRQLLDNQALPLKPERRLRQQNAALSHRMDAGSSRHVVTSPHSETDDSKVTLRVLRCSYIAKTASRAFCHQKTTGFQRSLPFTSDRPFPQIIKVPPALKQRSTAAHCMTLYSLVNS